MNTDQKELLQQLAQLGDLVVVRQDKRFELNEKGEVALQTQLDAVLYFLQRLDAPMLKQILDKELTYQNFDHKTFIRKLSDAFDSFLDTGDSYLNRFEGNCNSGICTNKHCKGFAFVGNKSNNYMDLILEIKEDKVTDIYECNDFSTDNFSIQKNNKVLIDE